MNLQQHLEIQASAQQWADDFMQNYNISASEMVDALTKVLLSLKDKILVEYFTEMTQQAQQENNQLKDMPQEEEIQE